MYVLCFTRPRYQVSVYRTIGPLVLKLLIAISVNYTAYLFFIKGSHSHMKNNTDYLDTPVTFERVGIFGCGFQQAYPMNILFQLTQQ